MHDSISQTNSITPTPPQLQQNAPKCNLPDQSLSPILAPIPPSPLPQSLSPRQLTAITLLCTGLSLELTAARLHINRATLYRWRTTHPSFQAELARRQRDLHDTSIRRFRLILLNALKLIDNGISSSHCDEDRLKNAFSLLRHVDLPSLLATPQDPLTTDQCLDNLIQTDRASRNLDPTLPITDQDREEYLSSLEFPEPPTSSSTHLRLAGSPTTTPSPYPLP
ncbi:MAG TPA: hypothetical protein VFE58_18425 [Tepidisphaeraceae bacterium]|nr:hypothetical protein [Tepidisphaeraceae bacterium]